MFKFVKPLINNNISIGNNDFYDKIMVYQKISGIAYWGYDEATYWKIILKALYCCMIYVLVLFNVPCLIYCYADKNDFGSQLALYWLYVYSIIYVLISICSGITFSLKGRKLRIFISKLRQLYSELNTPNKESLLRIKFTAIIYCIFVFGIVMVILFGFHSRSYWILYGAIKQFFYRNLLYSTDFYLIYFSSYIVIIQRLMNRNILKNNLFASASASSIIWVNFSILFSL